MNAAESDTGTVQLHFLRKLLFSIIWHYFDKKLRNIEIERERARERERERGSTNHAHRIRESKTEEALTMHRWKSGSETVREKKRERQRDRGRQKAAEAERKTNEFRVDGGIKLRATCSCSVTVWTLRASRLLFTGRSDSSCSSMYCSPV